MKILHTADWHLGRKLEGRSRHEEQVRVLDELCRIADDEQIDAVLIAGDVFDSYNPPAESDALFYRTMTRLVDGGRRAVVVIAGNHDSPDRLIASDPYARALGITTIGYPKEIPGLYDHGGDRVSCVESASSFIRLRLPAHDEILTLLALPYPSEARLKEVLTEKISDDEGAASDYNRRVSGFMAGAARAFRPGEANVIASHLFVRGGAGSDSERQIEVGGTYAVDAMSFPEEACYIALGHLHRPQEMSGPRDIRVRYSGSLLQYSFSEGGQEKGVTIVEIEGGRASSRTLPLNSGRTLEKWRVDGGTEELERRLAEVDPNRWLWVNVAVDEPMPLEYTAKLRKAHPGIIHCMPVYRQNERLDEGAPSISSLPLDEQFRHFIQDRYKEPCSDDVLKLFLELVAGGEEGSDEQ